jgi:ribonuclease Z
MADFEIILLGTGTPLPSPNRCGAAQLILAGEHRVMIDCGWGAARRLMTSGIPIGSVDTICFTHMHSDHVTDLPDFMIMRWTTGGTTRPLIVYGPEGTREMVEGFRAGIEPDVRFRIAHHGEKLDPRGVDVEVHELVGTRDPSYFAEIGPLRIAAFEVDHRPVVPAFGYRIDCDSRSVVLSGDTAKCDSLVRASRGASLLVSEALNRDMMRQRIDFLRASGNDRMAEILTEACEYHSSTADVAEMARDAGVRRLVLSHLIPPPPDDGPVVEAFIAGMSDVFSGELLVGRDLQRIAIT